MEAVYQLKPYELTDDFLIGLKAQYGSKEVKITVETPQNETAYLLQDPENRRLLLAGVEAGAQGRYSHVLTLEKIEEMAR